MLIHGEIVCLLGRNGVGKSTTLKSVIGLVEPRSGEVVFKGRNIARNAPLYHCQTGSGICSRGAKDISNPDGAREFAHGH